nr:hva22-like protein i [Quercus suber]
MMGSFLSRVLLLVFGYAYPAYECSKTVERNKPEMEQLFFWCQYWIIVAMLTVFERVGDTFISWFFEILQYVSSQLASQFESDKGISNPNCFQNNGAFSSAFQNNGMLPGASSQVEIGYAP